MIKILKNSMKVSYDDSPFILNANFYFNQLFKENNFMMDFKPSTICFKILLNVQTKQQILFLVFLVFLKISLKFALNFKFIILNKFNHFSIIIISSSIERPVSNHIQMNSFPKYNNELGVRKDILSFKQDDPIRRRFFICLKMLAILPCHPENKDLQFNLNTKTNNFNSSQVLPDQMLYAKPQRIHDELIASHVTCCQHSTPYFSYYHRNLLIYVQLQLNYADQVLRYKKPSEMNGNQNQWKALMDQYSSIIQSLKSNNTFQQKVMCHYWNPTNYSTYPSLTNQFNYPVELLPKNNLQNIDILFQKVNSHYPWQINIRTRWYQLSPEQYQKRNPKQDLDDIFSFDQNLRLNQNQKSIISGKSNPRSEDSNMLRNFFQNSIRRPTSNSSLDISDIISNQVVMRNVTYFDRQGNGEIMPIYNLQKDQYITNYGMEAHKKQWLSPDQIKSIQSKIGVPRNLTPINYNRLLPHYQFAYSYYKSQNSLISNYLGGVSMSSAPKDPQIRMQNSHNSMHNYLSFIMWDPNFSLTNLIFFPYHSWIDYQLQVKIRSLQDNNSYLQTQKQLNYNRQRTVYDILNKDTGVYTVGSYKLPDWVNPRVGVWRWGRYSRQAAQFYFQKNKIDAKASFRYAFKNTNFQAYVLNKTNRNVRRSDELNSIYKSEYQVDKPTSRFSYLNNLSEYNFGYYYEVYDNGSRKLMNKPNVPVLPSYVQQIGLTLEARAPRINQFLSSPPPGQEQTNIQLQSGNNVQGFLPSKFTPLKVKKQLLQNSILALGGYTSLIKSGVYHIQMSFLDTQFIKFNEKLDKDDIDHIKEGLFIKALTIFSKRSSSKSCPKCMPIKKFWVDISDQLREQFPQIWKGLNLYLLDKNRLIYSSNLTQKGNQDHQIKSSEVFKLIADPTKFKQFNILEGAQEIQFDVILGGASIDEEVSVKLDLQYYSMFNQQIQGVVSKTLYSLQQQNSKTGFQFYKILDLASSSGKNGFDQFDKYYYKKVRGQVTIGSKTKQFSFQIINYHRLIRYVIRIDVKGSEINSQAEILRGKQTLSQQQLQVLQQQDSQGILIEVQDMDYSLKTKYFTEWEDEL